MVLFKKGSGAGGGGGGGGGRGIEAKDGGGNRSAHATAPAASQLRKLEEDTDTFAHASVGLDLARAIQQARMAKGLNQTQLAALIAEKATVINQYEAGKAIPNGALIAKIERALGAKLPRPPKKK